MANARTNRDFLLQLLHVANTEVQRDGYQVQLVGTTQPMPRLVSLDGVVVPEVLDDAVGSHTRARRQRGQHTSLVSLTKDVVCSSGHTPPPGLAVNSSLPHPVPNARHSASAATAAGCWLAAESPRARRPFLSRPQRERQPDTAAPPVLDTPEGVELPAPPRTSPFTAPRAPLRSLRPCRPGRDSLPRRTRCRPRPSYHRCPPSSSPSPPR